MASSWKRPQDKSSTHCKKQGRKTAGHGAILSRLQSTHMLDSQASHGRVALALALPLSPLIRFISIPRQVCLLCLVSLGIRWKTAKRREREARTPGCSPSRVERRLDVASLGNFLPSQRTRRHVFPLSLCPGVRPRWWLASPLVQSPKRIGAKLRNEDCLTVAP
jgi:hypothetical protein